MKNQNFEISCEVLFEQLNNAELQETIGGAWYSFITDYFTPKKTTPLQKTNPPQKTYGYSGGGTATLHADPLMKPIEARFYTT